MKKLIISLVIFTATLNLFAQESSDYINAMVEQKKAMKMANNEQDYQNLANNFERIANAASDQWHPLYYAGMCYVNMSFSNSNTTQKDAYLDKAQKFIDEAMKIHPDESEIHVLQALAYQGRIQIDPAQRGMTFSQKAAQSLGEAKSYNPNNPRAYYLLGMNVLHTPEAFGGGALNACPLFNKAQELFVAEKPQQVLSPTWGGESNQQQISRSCSKKDN